MWDYEPCLYGWVRESGLKPSAARRPTPVPSGRSLRRSRTERRASDLQAGRAHPPADPLAHPPGELLYEPFSGSGTAIIAAEMTGRRCYALELSPAFVDVAVTRWQRFTGQTASLEGDGRSFDETAAGREKEGPSAGEHASSEVNQGVQHA